MFFYSSFLFGCGTVNLWYSGRIPATTKNASNFDGPDFIPNMEVFTVSENTEPYSPNDKG